MTRGDAWRSAGLVFVVALVARAWAASVVTFPTQDAAYYLDVARNLISGHGLTADSIFSYATPPYAFPRQAFELWLPMASFLEAIPMALLGGLLPAFAAAQVASVLVGSLVAVLAWRLAADVAIERELPPERARTIALGTGLAAGVYLPLVVASAQPDSTMPFAACVLGAVLVMSRTLRGLSIAVPIVVPRLRFTRRKAVRGAVAPPPAAPTDGDPLAVDPPLFRRLVAIGGLLGLAALARNEAIWLALAWAVLAWWATRPSGSVVRRLRAAVPLIGIPAVVSILVFGPWAVREWATFGSPLPAQALSNALFLNGQDVFAWNEPPTLERYLAAGLGTLVDLRITGFLHNLGTVLVLLGVPISALGVLALPWTARGRTLAPLALFSVVTFLVTTLVFPVATTWGTFLHAAGPIHVLVLVSAVLALDALFERLRASRSWTRPVAWLGGVLAVGASLLLTGALLPGNAAADDQLAQRYAQLPGALAAAGAPLPTDGTPVITDAPMWLSTETGVRAIALPDETPGDVLTLANQFSARLVIVDANNEGQWPEILDQEEPGAECFQIVPLSVPDGSPLVDVVAFRIVCSGPPVHGTP